VNVSACLVTRGDVDMQPVIDSLPAEWEVLVWWNGHTLTRCSPQERKVEITVDVPDLSVYGRYAAIEYATHDVIYVQDDDVIVSDPQAIVDAGLCYDGLAWQMRWPREDEGGLAKVVCNMPPEFRHDFYTDHALVGFGAAFHRDAPQRAFARLIAKYDWATPGDYAFQRTCDVVFTGLTPRVLVDVPKENLACAYASNRMWKQTWHIEERQRMLDLVKRVREA
jgi:hypothetical protein